jgi:ABC-type nitrate/sulfonate/bicarbonate transport system permease component
MIVAREQTVRKDSDLADVGGVRGATSSRRSGRRISLRLWSALSLATCLVLWQLAGMHTSKLFLPTPGAVVEAFWPQVQHNDLLSAYLSTMSVFLGALVCSLLVGVLIGVITGLSPILGAILDPITGALYSTPIIILIPLFVLWIGIGVEAKFAIVFLASVFPILITTQLGVAEVGPRMRELGTVFGATRRESLLKIIFPAITPYVVAGLRIAAPRAFVAVIGAEMLITINGLGGLAYTFAQQFATAYYFVPVVLVVVTSMIVLELVKMLERRFTPWRQGQDGQP